MSSGHMSVMGSRGLQNINGANNFQSNVSKSNGRSYSKVTSEDIISGAKSFLKTAGKILLAAAVITLGIAVIAGAVALPVAGVILVAVALGLIAKTKSCAKRTIMPKSQDQIESQPKVKDPNQISRQQNRAPNQEESLLKKYGYFSYTNAENIIGKDIDKMSDDEINLALEEKLLGEIEEYLHFLELEDSPHDVDKLDKFDESGKYGAFGSSGEDKPLVDMDKPFHKGLPQFFNEMVELRKILIKNDKATKDEPKKSVFSESEWKGKHRYNDFSPNNLVAYQQELKTFGRLLANGIKNKKTELENNKAKDTKIKAALDKIRVMNSNKFQAEVDLRTKELEEADNID